MSLLRSSGLSAAEKSISKFGDRLDSVLQVAQWGADGSQSPAGTVDLTTIPGGPEVFEEWLQRQSRREQEGFAPGNVASTAASHPAVQEAMMRNGN